MGSAIKLLLILFISSQTLAAVKPTSVTGISGGSGSNAAASATGSAVPSSASYTGFNSAGNLLGVSAANPFPVSQQGSTAVTGTFWQSTQPVSGTFWQATQPVSGTFWQTTQPVSISSMPSTPVTGTFWQSTQPVSLASLPSLVAGSAVIGHVIVDTAPTTAVTGTFFQATQPVSFTQPALVAGSAIIGKVGIDQTTPGTTNGVQVNAALPAGTNVIGHVIVDTAPSTAVTNTGTFAVQAALNAETTKVIGTVNVASAQTIAVTQATASNLNVTATPITITKGTQGATGVTTQDLKDAGRTMLRFYANAVASGTTGTETAITLTKSSGTAATTTAASFVITNGKTFRITQFIFGSRGNATATAQISNCRIRINTGGAVTTASTPVIYDLATATPATASTWDRVSISGNEGDEIAGNGTIQFGVTCASVFVTNAPTWFILLAGYEY